MSMPGKIYRAIGLMSGTSMDGVDVAAIETDGAAVFWAAPTTTVPYSAEFRTELLSAIQSPDGDVRALEHALTEQHIAAIRNYIDTLPTARHQIHLVGFHGHTLLHRPERGITRQLGNGAQLAAALGIDCVFDFRSNDVEAGGQGAPFAPIYHQVLGVGLEHPVAFVNIGGVSNITYVDGEDMLAFDCGPGNALIDDWVMARTGQPFDAGGALAARGKLNDSCLAALAANAYFDRKPPKSLDRLDFNAGTVSGLSAVDGAATLTAFTALSIARSLEHLPAPPVRWLITGGGRRNATLMAMLANRLPGRVEPIEAIGADGDGLEAQAFAYMAVRSLLGLPISFPHTTGVSHPMPGGRLVRASPPTAL